MDAQTTRLKNLKLLVRQWGGPASLAKKLKLSGPSYLSQLLSGHRPITEKTARKFETVAREVELVHPALFLPSAGPCCFLDPQLVHLNFERVNIFPRAAQFLSFLESRLSGHATAMAHPMPSTSVPPATRACVRRRRAWFRG